MQRRSRFAFRVALATVLLLVARWRPLLAQATPVTSQPSADPRALVALYFDTKTSAEERYRAYQQLLKLGPAIDGMRHE